MNLLRLTRSKNLETLAVRLSPMSADSVQTGALRENLISQTPQRTRSSSVSQAPSLKRGDTVVVKTWQEIRETLDDRGQLENLPFMPEMLRYCGRQFRVAKRADKTCDSHKLGLRHLPTTVHLENIRCDGEAHGGCQAGCTFFWKEAWLKRVEGPNLAEIHTDSSVRPLPSTYEPLWLEQQCFHSDTNYSCQTTQLNYASTPIQHWSLGHYLRDIRSGNVSVSDLVELIPWGWQYLYWFLAKIKLRLRRKEPGRTPTAHLDLRPGEIVRVKRRHEIVSTLNARGENRGLAFSAEMFRFAGRTFRVEARIEKIIDPLSGQLRSLQNPCIVLSGVACRGHCHFCPRALWHYWHEVWLDRVRPSECSGTSL